eukprot:CAMPEP_0170538992 /NCGR_PEP_ID=MMETSP0209-20121228/103643_1 /TAXON_ID=665100 ORGANISM="Litonotus pictus, Strain P1" /NCGR_SAMPLE_ID=MMETSP0209 /ASSEMBLY_ACC=CAM_ASM_000301 /LENGTH=455 /DNA_ID=CAMNT_0010840803 /DNA_START=510 /DNA_END=1878 /DNA_ORIENTATION=-
MKLDSIQREIQNDDAENTFRPNINVKSMSVEPLVYNMQQTHMRKMKSEVKVLKEKEKEEYFKPRLSSEKNSIILSRSKNFSPNSSMVTNTYKGRMNSTNRENNQSMGAVSETSLNMLNSELNSQQQRLQDTRYNKQIEVIDRGVNAERNTNNLDNENILIKDNNKSNFNNNAEFIPSSNSLSNTFKEHKLNNSKNNRYENLNDHNKKLSTNDALNSTNKKFPSNNSINNIQAYGNNPSGCYVSHTFDARQEKYREIHHEKLQSIKKEIQVKDSLRSDSITLIKENRDLHSKYLKNNDSNDSDIFTKNYNYCTQYKQKVEESKEVINEKIKKNSNTLNTGSYSQKLFDGKKDALFKKLFKELDIDHDNLITKYSVGVNRLNRKLQGLISPLIKELIDEDETLNSEEFVEAMSHLNNCLSYTEKNEQSKKYKVSAIVIYLAIVPLAQKLDTEKLKKQ